MILRTRSLEGDNPLYCDTVVQDRARRQRDVINNKCNFNGFSFYIHVASSYSFSPQQKIHVKFHDKKVDTSKQPSLTRLTQIILPVKEMIHINSVFQH